MTICYEDYLNNTSDAHDIQWYSSILPAIKDVKEKPNAGEASTYTFTEKDSKIAKLEKTLKNSPDLPKWKKEAYEAASKLKAKDEIFESFLLKRKKLMIWLPSADHFLILLWRRWKPFFLSALSILRCAILLGMILGHSLKNMSGLLWLIFMQRPKTWTKI